MFILGKQMPPSSRSAKPPGAWNLALQTKDLRVVQRASGMITELGAELDRQLEIDARRATRLQIDARPTERLRLLREATNRITRIANDAASAYAKASRATNLERAREGGNLAAANGMRAQLDAARRDLLDVLAIAGRRYPWSKTHVR